MEEDYLPPLSWTSAARQHNPVEAVPESYYGSDIGMNLTSKGLSFPFVDTLTLDIGNTHHLTQTDDWYDWTFFVRPSRADIIEKVEIVLVCI
jgi:hypothetical protein